MTNEQVGGRTAGDEPRWPAEVQALLARAARPSSPPERWVVRGAPGTGRTTLAREVVAAALRAGVPVERVAVFTHTGADAAAFAAAATRGLPELAGAEPLARTVHSLAFGVLRLAASRRAEPAPRLLAGAEHDIVVRDMLRGEAADGGADWPAHLRPALPTVGFARELRDLLLRSVERGMSPESLAAMGAEVGIPDWAAAAAFIDRHDQQLELHRESESRDPGRRGALTLNASELVSRALEELQTDPDLAAEVRGHAVVVVEDAHHLDPLSAELVLQVVDSAGLTVVTEDADQAVFRFRGADDRLSKHVLGHGGRSVRLDVGHRLSGSLARVAAAVADRLPGEADRRRAYERALDPARPRPAGTPAPRVLVGRYASAAAEADGVADFLRRCHLEDGIPWSRMAVVARGVESVQAALVAAFDAAGVPVHDAGAETAAVHDPVAAALVAVLRAGFAPLTTEEVAELLAGPLGGVDPVALAGLRRAAHAQATDRGTGADELLAAAVTGAAEPTPPPGSAPAAAGALRRVWGVHDAVVRSVRRGDSVEETLWAAWHTAGLESRLTELALGEGPWARGAGRSLDAVMALFDHAADVVDRTPGVSLRVFCDMVTARDLPAPRRAGRQAEVEAVSVLSAHSAVGREYEAVAVCGVQDGRWPSPRSRPGLLHVGELVDASEMARSGGGPLSAQERDATAAAAHAAQERRLFLVACTRARSRLLVSAVDAPGAGEAVASRFVDEVAKVAGVELAGGPDGAVLRAPRVLTLDHLVAELRAMAPEGSSVEGSAGDDGPAPLLAHLAAQGVRSADPGGWYGVRDPSGPREPAGGTDGPVTLSPSAFERAEQCPAQWFLERISGASDEAGVMLRGSFLHLAVQALAEGVPVRAVEEVVRRRWPALSRERGWFVDRECDELAAAVGAYSEWQRATRAERTLYGVEVPFEFTLPAGDEGRAPERPVRVRGRIDRIERLADGSLEVVDVKSSRTVVSKADGQAHPQLAVYQLAVRHGALDVGNAGGAGGAGGAGSAGGARLVYPMVGHASDIVATRQQEPLGGEAAAALEERVLEVAAQIAGPEYPARPGAWCARCAVRSSCPAVPDGEQVRS